MHIDRGSNENNNSPIPNWAPEWQSVTTDHAEDAVSSQSNLAALLHIAPGRSTAVIVPELGIRITYDSLRQQVMAMAESLAGAGIRRGDRVAMALPNGLPAIVSFLSAGIA